MQERVPNGSGAANGSELPYILNGGRREYQGSGGAGMHGSGASVSTVARRYDLKSNMVFRWRREIRRGLLNAPSLSRTEAFAPVGVIDEHGKLALPPKPAMARPWTAGP